MYFISIRILPDKGNVGFLTFQMFIKCVHWPPIFHRECQDISRQISLANMAHPIWLFQLGLSCLCGEW